MVAYIAYLCGYCLVRILPMKACYAIAWALANAYFLFARSDRAEMDVNIRTVLGQAASVSEVRAIKRRVFVNFGKYLADFFKFSVFTTEQVKQFVRIEGLEHLQSSLDHGKGAILLSLHLGNWELGAAVMSSLGYPMNALVLQHTDSRVDAFFDRQRRLNGLKTIPLGPSIRKGFEALRNGECLAIVGDKLYGSSGVEVRFFEKRAILPKGPAVFALKTGAPLVFCVMRREQDDSFSFVVEPPLVYEKKARFDQDDIVNVINDYTRYFEKHIKKNIDQWYAFKQIWDHV